LTVAITIPTYNRSHYLEQAIASVQAQTFRDWRLLVVDDGSTDGTQALLERLQSRDARIQSIRQPHRGGAAARNEGIRRLADAEFAIFLDDDDLWLSSTLETLVGALHADPTKVAAHGLAAIVDGDGRLIRTGELEAHQLRRMAVNGLGVRPLQTPEPTSFSVFAVSNAITTPGQVLIRRTALERARPFREPAPDWQMWLGLSTQGSFAFVSKIVLHWRWHGGNISSDHVRASVTRFRVHSLLLWSPGLSPSERRIAWIGFVRHYLDLARTCVEMSRLATWMTGWLPRSKSTDS
jgi:glycosyltransferase involved in cell wall biosynthesis